MRIEDIRAARERIADRVKKTELRSLPDDVSPHDGVRVHLKLECGQVSGSFKARGARHFLQRLLESGTPAGVITYSSGNHGRAVAEAARDAELPCVVTVPDDVDASKAEAMRAAGAEVIPAGPTSTSRERAARDIAAERGFEVIPPFDHEWIIAGQGTTALEILEEVPEPAGVWVPVGGGGLASGIAAAMTALRPDLPIHPVEPVGASPLYDSWRRGERVVLSETSSVADGLLPLAIGERNWRILSTARLEPVRVSDDSILSSLRFLREELDVPAEPSGAVAPTPLLVAGSVEETPRPGDHVAVVSGGNVAADRLQRLLTR